MNQEELNAAIDAHRLYLKTRFTNAPEGVRLEVIGANLEYANLQGAIGNSKEIISLQTLIYPIAYTIDRLQIGCKNYAITQWWEFDDETISAMDSGALDWWKAHKPILQALIDASPARGKSEK